MAPRIHEHEEGIIGSISDKGSTSKDINQIFEIMLILNCACDVDPLLGNRYNNEKKKIEIKKI